METGVCMLRLAAADAPGVGDSRVLLPVLMIALDFGGLRLLLDPCSPPREEKVSI